jgi:2-methylaconitate cis-trans-isomerase PrpF
MPIISADFTGVKTTPEPLPVGSYTARIESVEEGLSKANQPKLEVIYELTHQGFEGRKGYQSLSLQKQALFSLKRLLLAIGTWDEEDLSGPFEIDTADLVGEEVCIVVKANSYTNSDGETVHNTQIDRALHVSEAEGAAENVSAAAIGGVEEDAGTLFGSISA